MTPRDSQLITIGEFARLGGVSIKALRIYADLGLLQPAAINPQNRYRLYSRAQISRLHQVLLLKNAGFSLGEIGGQITRRDEASLAQIRANLLARAEEIQQQLAWIEGEIRAVRNHTSSFAPAIVKRTPAMRVLAERRRIDSYEDADRLLGTLAQTAPSAACLVSGAIWHDCGAKSRTIDCEAFWALNREIRAPGIRTLSGGTMASILHEGDESKIGATYQMAHRWIAEHRFEIAGPNREIYLASGTLIEIQFPIRRKV
jgi:DNA-binding transcriptional MerR regulator